MRASNLIGAWAIFASIFFAPPTFAQPAPAVELNLAVQHAIERPTIARTLSTTRAETDGLRQFYEWRDFEPVWFENGAPSEQARLLLAAIRDAAPAEGLDPTDYDATASLHDSDDADQLAAADIAISAALLRYASDVRLGHSAPPRTTGISMPSFTPVLVLAEAAHTTAPDDFVKGLAPSSPVYRQLRDALAHYQTLADAQGWPMLPDGPKLALGDRGSRVSILRRRLAVSGDLPPEAAHASGDLFDESLRQAVKRFQERHGVSADGVVGARTRELMNVSVDARIRQIAANMDRARIIPDDMGDPYVIVNTANFTLNVVEAGARVLEMRVINGRTDRPTPAFSDEITYIEFNPYWHVPKTILREDKLPILRRNPAALTSQGIRVIAPGGAQIDPTTIDWSTVSASNFPYSLRQDPGERNALGRIKFMFPNPYDIYLHDTPTRGLFQRQTRAFSSGCVRLEKPLQLAEFLMQHNGGWTRDRIEQTIAAGRNRAITLAKPVPVHIVYLTAWADDNGRMQFRDDIYNRDVRLGATQAMAGN